MKLKKVLLVCLIPAFVISGCGKTTKDETENITKQEITAEESAQDEQETGNTETEASGKRENRRSVQGSLCHGYLYDTDCIWGACSGGS